VLNTLERFLERMRDEPKHAAHFAQKITCDLTDFLGNDNGRMSVRHLGELPYFAMDKRANFVEGLNIKWEARR
jgi:hypothetical protein